MMMMSEDEVVRTDGSGIQHSADDEGRKGKTEGKKEV